MPEPDETAPVILGYVHPGWVHQPFMESVIVLMGKRRIGIAGVQSGVLISRARNKVASAFLEQSQASHLLFVDTDISFTVEDFDMLMDADKPIISGCYLTMETDGSKFIVGNVEKDGKWVRVPTPMLKGKTEPVKVNGVGMGFCLIQRRVLQDLSPVGNLWPFAELPMPENVALGEDLTFCKRAYEVSGYETFLHPGVKVGHHKTVKL